MQHVTELRILFATSFSDACFRTARAIAQLAGTCRLKLTIVHVAAPGQATPARRRELNSFFAEADHYEDCSRLLLESDNAPRAIAGLCNHDRFDLVMAPASDRTALPSWFESCFRAQLLKHCEAPLWTAGASMDGFNFKGDIKTVACLATFDRRSRSYWNAVTTFAARFQAHLHIVHAAPEIDAGMLGAVLEPEAPLMPDLAMDKLRSRWSSHQVSVTSGNRGRELPRLLERIGADVLFAGPGQALRGAWVPTLDHVVDRAPCPVVCVDGASSGFERWTFGRKETGVRRQETVVGVPVGVGR